MAKDLEITFPKCARCEARGWHIDRSGWPVECERCKSAREAAVRAAIAARRKANAKVST